MKSKCSTYAPLRTQKQYHKLIASGVVSRFGDSVDAIAFSLMVYEITGSASMMALVLAVNYLPNLVLQPIAGVVTERMNPVRLMSLCDLGRGLCVMAMAALYALGRLNTPLIVLAVLINSSLESLSTPAGMGLVPRILGSELYTAGIALRKTLSSAMELVGLAFAGAIVGMLGIPGALAIDAATFLISAAIIATIRPAPISFPPRQEIDGLASKIRPILRELGSVFVGLWRAPSLRAIALLGMALNFAAVPYSVFFTPYVTDALGGSAYTLSLLQVAFVVGMTAGSFVTPRLSFLGTRAQLLISGFGTALCYALMAVLPAAAPYSLRIALTTADVFAFGAFTALLNVVFSAAFMRSVPADQLSRVSGAINAIFTCAMPAGALLCSCAVRVVSVPVMLLLAGALMMAFFAIMSRMRAYHNL